MNTDDSLFFSEIVADELSIQRGGTQGRVPTITQTIKLI